MIIKVKDNCTQLPDDETAKGNYELEVSDDVVIDAMTTKNPSYWYVLIDGKVFKSEQQKGLKSMLFSSREKAENAVKMDYIGNIRLFHISVATTVMMKMIFMIN